MDEIDAALDFRNVSIVANYIKDRTKNAQFIIISLRSVKVFQRPHQGLTVLQKRHVRAKPPAYWYIQDIKCNKKYVVDYSSLYVGVL